MPIRDADILRVAGELLKWQSVAHTLGMGSLYISGIENNYGEKGTQREAFLRNWIARNGSKATYKTLCDALISLNLKEAAERISSMCIGETLAVGEVALADESVLQHMKSTQQGKMLCMSPQTGSKLIPIYFKVMHCNHCTSCSILVTGKHDTSSGKRLYYILADSHGQIPLIY